MKPLREKERRDAIASGLIPDPLKPRKLDEAITFQASCMEMCPEFEREEREYQKNVDRWEMVRLMHLSAMGIWAYFTGTIRLPVPIGLIATEQ
jgi:hypothetical protein